MSDLTWREALIKKAGKSMGTRRSTLWRLAGIGVTASLAAVLGVAGQATADIAISRLEQGDFANLKGIDAAGAAYGNAWSGPARWDRQGRIAEWGQGLIYAVNELGVSAGIVPVGDSYRAVTWSSKGQITMLDMLPEYLSSEAVDVDVHGAAVGRMRTSDGINHAVRWDRHGRVEVLAPLPGYEGYETSAYAMNDEGMVIGFSGINYVLWDQSGQPTVLRAPPGIQIAWPTAVNNEGTIIGQAYTTDYTASVVSWDGQGNPALLPLPPGGLNATPGTINDDGVITGTVNMDPYRSSERAVRWDPDGRITVLSLPAGYLTSTAGAVNRRGVIVGELCPTDDVWNCGNLVRAARWDPDGGITILPTINDMPAWAQGISDQGTIYGSLGFSWDNFAVIWR
jgi:uncharacterized membrane protein